MGEENIERDTRAGGRARIWGVRTDEGLREIYIDVDIVADIKKKRFEWVGHVARMNQGRTNKKTFDIKPKGLVETESIA